MTQQASGWVVGSVAVEKLDALGRDAGVERLELP